MVYQIEEGHKFDIVEMYLDGEVDNWYQTLKLTRGRVAWNELSEMIIKRFRAKGIIDKVEEFNKLQQ